MTVPEPAVVRRVAGECGVMAGGCDRQIMSQPPGILHHGRVRLLCSGAEMASQLPR